MLIGTQGYTFFENLFISISLCATVGIFGYLIGNISDFLILKIEMSGWA